MQPRKRLRGQGCAIWRPVRVLRGGAGQGPLRPDPGQDGMPPMWGAAQERPRSCGLHNSVCAAVLRSTCPRTRSSVGVCFGAHQGWMRARCRHEILRAMCRNAPSRFEGGWVHAELRAELLQVKRMTHFGHLHIEDYHVTAQYCAVFKCKLHFDLHLARVWLQQL